MMESAWTVEASRASTAFFERSRVSRELADLSARHGPGARTRIGRRYSLLQIPEEAAPTGDLSRSQEPQVSPTQGPREDNSMRINLYYFLMKLAS